MYCLFIGLGCRWLCHRIDTEAWALVSFSLEWCFKCYDAERGLRHWATTALLDKQENSKYWSFWQHKKPIPTPWVKYCTRFFFFFFWSSGSCFCELWRTYYSFSIFDEFRVVVDVCAERHQEGAMTFDHLDVRILRSTLRSRSLTWSSNAVGRSEDVRSQAQDCVLRMTGSINKLGRFLFRLWALLVQHR